MEEHDSKRSGAPVSKNEVSPDRQAILDFVAAEEERLDREDRQDESEPATTPKKLKVYICNECDLETPSETEAEAHTERTRHVLKLRKVTKSQEIEYLIGELQLSGGRSENRVRKIHAVRRLLSLGKSLAWIIGVLDESNTRRKLTEYVHAALRPTIPNLSLRENMVRAAKYEVYGDSRVKIRTIKVEDEE